MYFSSLLVPWSICLFQICSQANGYTPQSYLGHPILTESKDHHFIQSVANLKAGAVDNDMQAAVMKANEFLAKLTLSEKARMVTGTAASGVCTGNVAPIKHIGFRGLCVLDGPAAVNPSDLISIFPAGVTTAASWDRSSMYKRAYALGSEFKDKGINIALA